MKSSMNGVFLTLEGGEGTGKTTQLGILAERLRGLGQEVVSTREPGGTTLGLRLRDVLVRRSEDPPGPMAELFLYAADRSQHVETVIRPALEKGTVVLCDRYADATEAYQGHGRELSLPVIHTLNELATGGLRPDRTVLLDLDPGVGVERSLRRLSAHQGPREERFETEALAFHRRVREGYLSIAQAHPERVRAVDAAGDVEEVGERVWRALEDLFRG